MHMYRCTGKSNVYIIFDCINWRDKLLLGAHDFGVTTPRAAWRRINIPTLQSYRLWSLLSACHLFIRKCTYIKNGGCVSRPSVHFMLLLWKSVRMKQWENCLRSFAAWGNSSAYKTGVAMFLSRSCFLHQPQLVAGTLPTGVKRSRIESAGWRRSVGRWHSNTHLYWNYWMSQ